jgi:hypothetical protein
MEIKHASDIPTSSSQVIEQLGRKGMGKEFKFDGAGITLDNKRSYRPNELQIIKVFQFDGVSNPSHKETLYLVRGEDGVTGYIQDGYGSSADHEVTDLMNNFARQIPQAEEEEQQRFEL